MSLDPDSILRPLRQRATDLDALRGGAAASGTTLRVAAAVETTLRRMLRDDATAPVELRLRALAAEDLPTADLLAELRRRNRMPMELAAAVHELDQAAQRLAAGEGESERDGRLAVSVAEGLEAHIQSLAGLPLEDPALPDP